MACRLYFDLEYKTGLNPEADGDAMVEVFKEVVLEFLASRYKGLVVRQHHVIDLESSTATKFSRHLVVHTPDAAFENVHHVGAFVAALRDEIVSRAAGGDEAASSLLVAVDSNHET